MHWGTGKLLLNKNYHTQYNFNPDPYGDNVTLYRGTTGSEGKGGPLFMTDNPEYAASYVQNGGNIVEITISRSTVFQMKMNGVLTNISFPMYHINGTSGVEYQFSPSIKPIIIKYTRWRN